MTKVCCKNPACKCKCKRTCKKSEDKLEDINILQKGEENGENTNKTGTLKNQSKVGINGFGRIGRAIFKRCIERGIDVLAINDPFMSISSMIYNLKYDTAYGRFGINVSQSDDKIKIDENAIRVYNQADASTIDWSGVSIVIESSGVNTSIEEASKHLRVNNGPSKVIIAGSSPDAPCLIYGINNESINLNKCEVISCGSPVTNCVAPIVSVLIKEFTMLEALFTVVFPFTAEQCIVDGPREYLRKGRAACKNIIPVSLNDNNELTKVFPEYDGKINGIIIHIPTVNVAALDLTFRTEQPFEYSVVIDTFTQLANSDLKGIVDVTEEELVSKDFVGNPHAATIDVNSGIALNKNFMKIVAWQDNEFGYSNRVLDIVQSVLNNNSHN